MWRCEDVKMKMRRCEDVKMWRCDVKMRRCEDVKMWRWEDEKIWRWKDEKMWRCEDVKKRRCEDVKMRRCEDVRMRRCEDVKIFDRPPLLEVPFSQTLSGKKHSIQWLATFLPFRAPASSFCWLFLFFWSSFFFSCLTFFHVCFFICPYCRKFDFSTSFDNVYLFLIYHIHIF